MEVFYLHRVYRIAGGIAMRIYLGRWDWIPDSWEGIQGLYSRSEEEIRDLCRKHGSEVYTPKEFEETFNYDTIGKINGEDWFIKIF